MEGTLWLAYVLTEICPVSFLCLMGHRLLSKRIDSQAEVVDETGSPVCVAEFKPQI
jgi:hypothetical protein